MSVSPGFLLDRFDIIRKLYLAGQNFPPDIFLLFINMKAFHLHRKLRVFENSLNLCITHSQHLRHLYYTLNGDKNQAKRKGKSKMITEYKSEPIKIRGINYVVHSYFHNEKILFESIANLILNDYQSSKEGEVTNESLLDNGIDFEAE